jgi:cytoskeletal protein CcmA (bactofilin family)
MAIFNAKHQKYKSKNKQSVSITPKPVNKGATVIMSGTKLKGDILESSSLLRIDGEFEGSIHSNNTITIESQGRVTGHIVAKKLIINGFFDGTAKSVSVEILSRGHFNGALVYNVLTVEAGGSFSGEITKRSEWDTEISSSKKPERQEQLEVLHDVLG